MPNKTVPKLPTLLIMQYMHTGYASWSTSIVFKSSFSYKLQFNHLGSSTKIYCELWTGKLTGAFSMETEPSHSENLSRYCVCIIRLCKIILDMQFITVDSNYICISFYIEDTSLLLKTGISLCVLYSSRSLLSKQVLMFSSLIRALPSAALMTLQGRLSDLGYFLTVSKIFF